MKKLLTIFLAIAVSVVFAVWQLNRLAADTSLSQWQVGAGGYRLALQQQVENKKPVLMFFHTDWCQACKELESNVLGQKSIIEYLKKFNTVQIDPEKNQPNHDLADQYSVYGYPTLLLIHNGTRTAIRLPIGGKSSVEKFIKVCNLALRKENT